MAAAIVLAGCSFHAHEAVTDAAGDAIGAADTDGATLDTDGDGVADGDDNCPAAANPDQANEDGDDRGDACDLCPHLAGTVPGSDDDDDGDGIGNQCDPRVGTDRRVVFLPFNDPHDLDKIALRAGSNQWSISNGALHQTDTAVTTPQNVVWTGENIDGPVVVESQIQLDSVPAGTGTRLAAVEGGYYDGTTVDVYACGLRGSDAAVAATVGAWHFVNPPTIGTSTTAATTGTITAGKQAHAYLKATLTNAYDSQLDCGADASTVTLPVSGYIPAGYPGFRTLGVTASFDYLFVVAIGS